MNELAVVLLAAKLAAARKERQPLTWRIVGHDRLFSFGGMPWEYIMWRLRNGSVPS